MVVIASFGGLSPLFALLAGLPASFPVPLLVLRHHPASDQPDRLAGLLARRTLLPVRSACRGVVAYSPGVTVIPHGHTAAVHPGGHLRLRPQTGRIGPRRADGDALLASAAAASAPGAVIGVVLSGMMHDGTEGIRAVKRHGGRVLAQDPATAQVPTCPPAPSPPAAWTSSCPPSESRPRLLMP